MSFREQCDCSRSSTRGRRNLMLAAASVTVVALAAAVVTVVATAGDDGSLSQQPIWTWKCEEEKCVRYPTSEVNDSMEFSKCKLTCGALRSLWPQPTGPTSFGSETTSFLVENLKIQLNAPPAVKVMITEAWNVFLAQLEQLHPLLKEDRKPGCSLNGKCSEEIASRTVQVSVVVDNATTAMGLDTNEYYQLSVNQSSTADVEAVIYGPTFFGARHGLETLFQMINYDTDNACLQILNSLLLSDAPVYPVRALTVDTARSYIPVKDLKRTIDGMAMNKLNTLHWHITDTHSFPIEIPREPRMMKHGAYSTEKVYKASDVKDLVEYARVRGVRVVPELDAPAHAGYGWQWGEKAGLGKLVVCLGEEPWTKSCVEPPCGQMNIVNDNMYDVLQKIYADFHDMFQPDMFHMGGDEIKTDCWKNSKDISDYIVRNGGDPTDDHEYMKLWASFQTQAANIWGNISTVRKTPLVLWTSDLTASAELRTVLPVDQYVIQVWTTGTDQQIGDLLADGYKLIMSNYDAWYLDCGFSAWIGSGLNWCTPYKSWHDVYNNSPRAIALAFQQAAGTNATYTDQMLGGSAALWSEQSDRTTLDSRLWPRGAALAERLWAEPAGDSLAALTRLVHHRERMVARGLTPEALQPEYCHQNEGKCVRIFICGL